MTPLIVTATLTALAAVTLPVRRLRHIGGISTRDLTVLAVAVVLYTAGIELEIIPITAIGIATLIAGCVSAATPPRDDELDPVDQLLATAPASEFPPGYETATTLRGLAGLPENYGDGGLTKLVIDYPAVDAPATPAGDDRVAHLQHTVAQLSDRLVALGDVVDESTRLTAQGLTGLRARIDAITGGTP